MGSCFPFSLVSKSSSKQDSCPLVNALVLASDNWTLEKGFALAVANGPSTATATKVKKLKHQWKAYLFLLDLFFLHFFWGYRCFLGLIRSLLIGATSSTQMSHKILKFKRGNANLKPLSLITNFYNICFIYQGWTFSADSFIYHWISNWSLGIFGILGLFVLLHNVRKEGHGDGR